jgi:hypothetical protein
MTQNEIVVEDMDMDTIYGLKSRRYGHRYRDQKEDGGNRDFLIIERGSGRLDKKKRWQEILPLRRSLFGFKLRFKQQEYAS